MEETGVPGENHRTVVSQSLTSSHNNGAHTSPSEGFEQILFIDQVY